VELIFTNRADSISTEEINRLFEPFYRRSNSIKEDGFGLGLTIVRRIIGLHKGTITVESKQVNGTITFKIVLPVMSPEPASLLSKKVV
jgi:signal transduction histidine kinase